MRESPRDAPLAQAALAAPRGMARRRVRRLCVLAVVAIAALAVALVRRGAPGPILRAIALDQEPVAALVDERSGRAFILTADGSPGTFPLNSPDPHGNGHVRVLATASGASLRVERAGYRPCALVADGPAGRILVAYATGWRGNGGVLTLDAADGAVVRAVSLGADPCASNPAVNQRRGTAFLVGGDGRMHMIDAHSGQLMRSTALADGGAVSLATDDRDDRIVAISGGDSSVEILDSATPRHLHTVTVGVAGAALSPVADPASRHLFLVDQSASTVTMLDMRTGTVGATSPVAHGPRAWASDASTLGDRLLVGGERGLSILDSRTGAVLHTLRLGDEARQILVDGPAGRAFILTSDGMGDTANLHVVGVASGKLLSTIMLPGVPLSAAVDPRHHRLIAVDQQGGIDVLDTRTGRLIHTLATVPSTVAIVAVDTLRGRAIVLQGRGIVDVPDRWAWLPGPVRAALPFIPRSGASYQVAPAGVTVVDDTR